MEYTSRSLRRRGESDKWEVSLMHKDPSSGKPKRTFHTVIAKTRKTAERKRNELIVELSRKEPATTANPQQQLKSLVDSFLAFKEREGAIEPSTLRGYHSRAKAICQSIGSTPLCDLNPAFIREWTASLTAKGYAPQTAMKTFRLLSQALAHAVAQGVIPENPCATCKPPKTKRRPINVLNRTERSRMLLLSRQIQPMPLGLAIELALTTGMRRGEICALRWSDLLDDGSVVVRRALGEGPGGYYEKAPKTPESRRSIPLVPQTFQTLRTLKEATKKALEQNPNLDRDPYILGTTSTASRPYNPGQLSRDFSLLCKLHGFACTFHGLRHTFATMMIAEGTDVKTVSSYLGHASASMTLDIYAEVDAEAKRAAVAKIESAFDI